MKILANGIAVLEGDTHIGAWVEQSGRLDHDQWLLPRILPHIPVGGTVVDAGAYIGDHTIAYLEKVGPKGRVLAFEPNPEAARCLSHNCPNADCYRIALECYNGESTLAIDPSNYGASHVSCSSSGPIIMCQTLDSFNLGRLDFLKADVEGCEVKLVCGAVNTIKRHKPVMLFEVNSGALVRHGDTSAALRSVIESLGYRTQPIDPSHNPSMPQWEMLCLPTP